MDNNNNVKFFVTPIGAAVAALCFFLPWVEFSCGGMRKTASGSELGGILWIVFLAALVILITFFYFRSQNQLSKSVKVIQSSSYIALIILAIRYLIFMSGEKTEMGTIRPQDIGFSIQFGAIGTLLGFLTSLIGSAFLKERKQSPSPDKNL